MTAETGRVRPRFFSLASPVWRLVLIGVLLLLLNIPMAMIAGVVTEREARRDGAVAEIVGKWGGRQTLAGPILRVPYSVREQTRDAQGRTIEEKVRRVAYFLPRGLKIDADIRGESRKRGLFEVPVYSARLRIQGDFARPDFSTRGVSAADIDWKHAELLLSLSEPRALHADAALQWAGHRLRFEPSTGMSGCWPSAGIHVPLGLRVAVPFTADTVDFDLALGLNGAEQIDFAPTAEETAVAMKSDWPHPSFQGGWLPVDRSIGADGFTARWSVSYLGRNAPQSWDENNDIATAIQKSAFGVAMVTPVDQYTMAERITKYALLTLVFTFAVIWLVELLSGTRVHVIQYGFVGLALCLFGLLQLSFAEHFGFTCAFLIAAAAVVVLVTLYCRSLLGSLWRAVAVGAVLGGLYAYLYSILRAEDHALLGGSLALFFGLAITMWLTRRIDWFAGSASTAAESA